MAKKSKGNFNKKFLITEEAKYVEKPYIGVAVLEVVAAAELRMPLMKVPLLCLNRAAWYNSHNCRKQLAERPIVGICLPFKTKQNKGVDDTNWYHFHEKQIPAWDRACQQARMETAFADELLPPRDPGEDENMPKELEEPDNVMHHENIMDSPLQVTSLLLANSEPQMEPSPEAERQSNLHDSAAPGANSEPQMESIHLELDN
ncbi:uncharacterized protein LOC122724078 [Manihot esculenta]|uniref:Uncharacterized protein n=1 Tax=Manihot esculenta TaxID=3983 RepID=A0ACB7HCB5_MANES|nr:uncharacterized protein LOC122724078 [Manihot esculenta]KAG8650404.1 hypothetical protein MANES_07G039561v8 [Manihot esculenta]